MSRGHEKLIRDGIPALAQRSATTLQVRHAGAQEWPLLLARKLVEEGAEVMEALQAGNRGALVDELADLQAVVDAMARHAGVAPAEVQEAVRRRQAERGGFERGLVLAEAAPRPARLHGGMGDSLLDTLRREFARCRAAYLAVSFILASGLDALEGAIRAALLRRVPVRLLTTDYLDVTDPAALARLLALPGDIEVRVFSHPERGFHPKAYLFDHGHGAGRAYVGSANLSRAGLSGSVEWTWTVADADLGHPMDELLGQFEALYHGPHASVLTPAWVDTYARRRRPRADAEFVQPPAGPAPRPAQALALDELERLRLEGESRALVIAATGLGKTWIAAFDARGFERVLFIAHRAELLHQAAAAFATVHPGRSRGLVLAEQVELDRDLVFASVQTLSRPTLLADPALRGFDYVVIDEFHHAAAPSYLRLLERLAPRFLLGLTATPYRGDNRDLHALCDGNVACELGLFKAIALGWLCPFRYHGVADPVDYDATLLNATRTAYDEQRLEQRYADPVRTAQVVAQYRAHAGRAALGFCVSIGHALAMAQAFRAAGIAAEAVHSQLPPAQRATALARLEAGELRILFAVDLYNEGVDIPWLDLVLFLRPTESMTVFLQQLGRGLRVHPGKTRLTVVDFIGNHRRAQFKLPFLVGLEEDGPDTVARALAAVRAMGQGRRPDTLPDGVEVHLEALAVDRLEQALRAAEGQRPLLRAAFDEVATALGRRPTLVELDRRGRYAPALYLRAWGSWFATLHALGRLTPEEERLEAACGDFLREVESTAMTRSYKMVTLLALLERDAPPGAVSLAELVACFRSHFAQPRYRADVAGTVIDTVEQVAGEVLGRYIVDNPVRAWTGGNRAQPSRYFAYDRTAALLRYTGPHGDQPALLRAALRERVDYRLQRYHQRRAGREPVFKVIPNGRSACIMLGKDAGDGLPRGSGWQLVRLRGRFHYARFAQVAINVIKDRPEDGDSEPNRIVTLLEGLFEDPRLLEFPRRYQLRIRPIVGAGGWDLEALDAGAPGSAEGGR